MEEFDGLGIAVHGGEVEGVPSVVVAMKEGSTVQEKLDDPGVSLLGGDVKRRHSFTVAFVDDKRAFFRIEKLADSIVSSVPKKVPYLLNTVS